jgi:hypothetical protein
MSQTPVPISMRSKKQHIRLWFECLQICQSQNEYSDNLTHSQAIYEDWGIVSNVKFDDWWKSHSYLFSDGMVQEVSKVSKVPNTITLSIPLNEKISTITRDVKKLVEARQKQLLVELGEDPENRKSKALNRNNYAFTQSEIKGVFHYINLEIYKIYLELGKPAINRAFLIEVRKSFDARPKSKLKNSMISLPSIEQFEKDLTKNVDVEDIVRSVRRGIKTVEKTLKNVSLGKFP